MNKHILFDKLTTGITSATLGKNKFFSENIVLFVVNGLGNVTGAILTIRKYKYAAQVAALFGLILMVWIAAQVAWIGYTSILQPLYFATGLLQMLAAYRYIKLNENKRFKP